MPGPGMKPCVIVVAKNPELDSWFFQGCTWELSPERDVVYLVEDGKRRGSFRVSELVGWYDSEYEVKDHA